ncbi:IS630 family transposase [Ectothiorhodospira sp. BSL-9]|uniref:IS630 family transposase n=1 Tax=Ectothiorhodospira sp. BSL-9 TaxID=1442136 RepID=UPI0007B44DB5|nr:IS630 family transposase [Ectothiorhodospira sp. BSL-9]ANB03014.1 endonuclease DDE [Ectothiorhodospira sp. BSL-9]
MEREDARTLHPAAQEEKRKTAVSLSERGFTRQEIGEELGVHHLTVGRWLKKYREGGWDALLARRRGRRLGSGRQLDPEDEEYLQQQLRDHTPDQLNLQYALWTREAVRQLIREETGQTVPIRSITEYLKRWGFTVQKPKKQAYEQQAADVQRWLTVDYPAIQARAKEEKAEIHWGDETGLRSDCQHVRGYAPKGQTPVLRQNAKRASINLISTITNRGKVRFRIYEGTMHAGLLIDFMKRLVKSCDQKIFLILDNLRVHHAYKVRDWLSDHKDEIEVFYLPPYSHDLNPDEYLNCDIKAGVHSGPPARNKEQLKQKAMSHMRKLQKLPRRVASYFQAKAIQYAAA